MNGQSQHETKPVEIIPEIGPLELVQAASVLSKDKTSGEIQKMFPEARKLLGAAAMYLKNCNTQRLLDFAGLDGVSFNDVLESNQKEKSESEKLLPGIGTKKGLVKLIRRYYSAHALPLTKQQRARIFKKTGTRLASIPDQTGELYIKGEFLPTSVLRSIQEWRKAERKKRGVKKNFI